VKHVSGPDLETRLYVVSSEPMDTARVNWPAHIGNRDSGLGYGDRCWLIFCGGVDLDAGIEAIRAAYPDVLVTANRQDAAARLREAGQVVKACTKPKTRRLVAVYGRGKRPAYWRPLWRRPNPGGCAAPSAAGL
jgi:hypothetical protein